MFKRGPDDERFDSGDLEELDADRADPELETPDEGAPPRIRCPKCAWVPRKDSEWSCTCLHHWNTFDTAGRCPACGVQWEDTMCLACHRWSKHLAWYVDREPG